MPYIATFKARKRLEWQDTAPKTGEQRSAYAIAAKHQPAMTRAIRRYFNDLRSPESIRRFEAGLRKATTAREAVDALPFEPAEERLRESLQRVLANITEDAGRAESRRGIEVPEPVIKARVRYSFNLDNPFSLRRIAQQTFDLVKGITASLRESIRGAVETGFAEGRGAKAIAEDILQTNLGLTKRDVEAVARTRRAAFDAAREAGFNVRQSTARASRTATAHHGKLLERRAMNIARTETIRAEAQGVKDSWMAARDAGVMPPQTRKVWIASVGSDRTCEICEELGTTYGPDSGGIPLDESFLSAVTGESYDMPPSHVACRCSGGLVTTIPT